MLQILHIILTTNSRLMIIMLLLVTQKIGLEWACGLQKFHNSNTTHMFDYQFLLSFVDNCFKYINKLNTSRFSKNVYANIRFELYTTAVDEN